MLKKILKISSIFMLLAIITIIILTWFFPVRIADGRLLGYSGNEGEYLFFQYQNIPVRNDGPYLLKENNVLKALYVNGDGVSPSKLLQQRIKNNIEISVDNNIKTKFIVPLRKNYKRSNLIFPNPKKLLAISDLEGEFDIMVKLLQANGVIDNSLNWVYGSGHLVLIGDMVDRGNNVVPLLWLIYKLEAEAKLAGGDIHFILGNHERYLLDGRTKSVNRKYYGTFRTTGMSQRELWSKKSELGRWLRSKPVMIKIGSTLFLHAGISPKILSLKPTLKSIDKEAEKKFAIGDAIRRTIKDNVIHDAGGIIFYRGLAMSDGNNSNKKASNEHVDQILKEFKVKRIAIGHTIAEHVGYNYEGRIIRVDVDHSDEVSEGLFIKNDSLWRVNDKGNKFILEKVNNLD